MGNSVEVAVDDGVYYNSPNLNAKNRKQFNQVFMDHLSEKGKKFFIHYLRRYWNQYPQEGYFYDLMDKEFELKIKKEISELFKNLSNIIDQESFKTLEKSLLLNDLYMKSQIFQSYLDDAFDNIGISKWFEIDEGDIVEDRFVDAGSFYDLLNNLKQKNTEQVENKIMKAIDLMVFYISLQK
jgi:hypothetical protein